MARLFGLCLVMMFVGPRLWAVEAGSVFPFVLPWDDSSPRVTNVSDLLEKPAGQHGFVTPRDSHLYVGDTRIRFFGVNFCFSGSFPSHEHAEEVAARLAKFGVNCVRFHHMDNRTAPGGILNPDLRTLDPDQLDRLDYLISRLKANGIYADLNLHVSRNYPGMEKWKGMPNYFKGVDNLYSGMIAMQRDYARQLLTHRNPYTGLRYVDEPAVAFIEINNENGLFSEWWNGSLDEMPEVYSNELKSLWNSWLRSRYRSTADLKKAWKSRVEELGLVDVLKRSDAAGQTTEQRKDWVQFLCDTELNYWTGMSRYIKEDLKAHSPVIGTQANFSPIWVQAKLDVIDAHAYWKHPHFPGKPWDPENWTVENVPMSASESGGTLPPLAMSRVEGKPFVVTEYNHPAPNTYSSEAFLLLAAYASMQDWDGIFAFDYSSSRDNWDLKRIPNYFSIDQHSTKMATLPAASATFLRGDVEIAGPGTVVTLTPEKALEAGLMSGPRVNAAALGVTNRQALQAPVSVFLDGAVRKTQPRKGKEFVWHSDSHPEIVTLNTPRSKMVIGKTGLGPVDLSGVVIDPGENLQDWAAISLTVMQGRDFASSGSILITATGYVENTGMGWKNREKTSVGRDWGTSPSLVEGIPAAITLPVDAKRVRVWALDERGQRKEPVPVVDSGGRARVEIGLRYKTLWYEVGIG